VRRDRGDLSHRPRGALAAARPAGASGELPRDLGLEGLRFESTRTHAEGLDL